MFLTLGRSNNYLDPLVILSEGRRKTIGKLIEESLEYYGIKTTRSAERLVAKARARASPSEAEALRLAVAETRAARRR